MNTEIIILIYDDFSHISGIRNLHRISVSLITLMFILEFPK